MKNDSAIYIIKLFLGAPNNNNAHMFVNILDPYSSLHSYFLYMQHYNFRVHPNNLEKELTSAGLYSVKHCGLIEI